MRFCFVLAWWTFATGLAYGAGERSPSLTSGASDAGYQQQEAQAFQLLLRNTSLPDGVPGNIVAAPSRDKPNYYYHWVRDGSIALRALLAEYEAAPAGEGKAALKQFLLDHIDFNLRLQKTALSDGTGLGEARFLLSGEPVPGPWGQPQQDGPALRIVEFSHLAELLLAEGDEGLVRRKLYDSALPTSSLIKQDLEYLSHHWRETSFDIWEELRAEHFYTRLLTHKALRAGAALASRLGDPAAASFYAGEAAALEQTLDRHWQPWRGYIVEALNADYPSRVRTSGMDSAVLVAVLSGYEQDSPFAVTDYRVLATAQRLELVFRDLYPVNDPELGFLGVAIGRYPEDRYDGTDINGVGHSWPFLTATFAQFYHRLARSIERTGSLKVTALNQGFFSALPLNDPPLAGTTISKGSCAFNDVVAALRRKGDGFLARVQKQQTSEGALYEQNDRITDLPLSAPHLSMSYAAYILALRERN